MPDDGGIGRLQRRLAAIPSAIVKAAQPAVAKSAEDIAAAMKALAPAESGDLRDSIAVTLAGQQTPAYSQPGGSMTVPENAAAVTVGNHAVRYAHLVEYGTSRTPAHPYFWPAFRLNRNIAARRIKRAVGQAVRKNWGRSGQ